MRSLRAHASEPRLPQGYPTLLCLEHSLTNLFRRSAYVFEHPRIFISRHRG